MTTSTAAAAMTGATATPAATAAAATTTAASTTTATTTTTPAANDWLAAVTDDNIKNWATAKGFDKAGPTQALESAYNLEKLIGFDKAGRTIVMPKDDATKEEIKAFQAKLGVPEKAEEYLKSIKVPEGQGTEFATQAAQWFHEAGLTPKQAAVIAEKWNAHAGAIPGQQAEQAVKDSDAAFSKVVASWGKEADANIELGRRAFQQFVPAKDADARAELFQKMANAVGTETVLKMFADIGRGLGEHKLTAGDGQRSGGLSPAEALAKITALKSDQVWTKAYLNGDQAKIAEITRLHEAAYPVTK